MKTLRIVDKDSERGYVIINEGDFDADVHTPYRHNLDNARARKRLAELIRASKARADRKRREQTANVKENMIETVKIKSDDTPMGFVILNRVDFDPRIHELHESETAQAPTNAEVAANLAADKGMPDYKGRGRTAFEPINDHATGRAHRSTGKKEFDERREALKAELDAATDPLPAA